MAPGTSTGRAEMPIDKLLRTYLNDHLAGATAGAALARRIAAQHERTGSTPVLRRLAGEVAQDRKALLEIMSALGVRPNPLKAIIASVGEKCARLKPNNFLLRRSPLSDLLELEAMRLGVEGKACAWRTLHAFADRDARLNVQEIAELQAKAQRQLDELETLRYEAAALMASGRTQRS